MAEAQGEMLMAALAIIALIACAAALLWRLWSALPKLLSSAGVSQTLGAAYIGASSVAMIVISAAVFQKETITPLQAVGFALQLGIITVYSLVKTFPDHFEQGVLQGLRALLCGRDPQEAQAELPAAEEEAERQDLAEGAHGGAEAPPSTPGRSRTVFIFDRDDALLCTSWLKARGNADLGPDDEHTLEGIQRLGKKVLDVAMSCGRTFVVSHNATNGWPQHSAAARWVIQVPAEVIQVQVPAEVCQWKRCAFEEVKRALHPDKVENVIWLGDPPFGMDPASGMGKIFCEGIIKTIRFCENPSPKDLLQQLGVLDQKFLRIVDERRWLKITLRHR